MPPDHKVPMPHFTPPRIAARAIALLALVGIAGGVALAWHPALDPISPPDRAFTTDQIARGAALSKIGDCAVCHTANGGRPYAGGRGVPTPFGTVFATNITPDPDTGIGTWSPAAFRRAMRDGIARDGRNLYPVLPYPHFTRATDADIDAIYAFLMTRPIVRQSPPPNQLPFPFNVRAVLNAWNLLYLRPGPWHPDPARDARWNRGAYLVEAVGHCGACHTPRNALGAERDTRALAGGEAENWYAPALQASSPAPLPWREDELTTYLQTGFQAQHGAAGGPMTAVVEELAGVPEADVRAIAAYVASLMPKPQALPRAATAASVVDAAAAAMFDGACGGCHADIAPMTRDGAPPLSLATAVNAPTPQGVIAVILHGLPWREGKAAPYMPEFASALTDAQLASLVGFLRARYSDQPAWTDLAPAIPKARQDGGS